MDEQQIQFLINELVTEYVGHVGEILFRADLERNLDGAIRQIIKWTAQSDHFIGCIRIWLSGRVEFWQTAKLTRLEILDETIMNPEQPAAGFSMVRHLSGRTLEFVG